MFSFEDMTLKKPAKPAEMQKTFCLKISKKF